MDYQKDIRAQLEEARLTLEKFLEDPSNSRGIESAAELISKSIDGGGKVLSCGNGGSHCDAMHFAEEMTGKFRSPRRPLPAIAISDVSHITCTANDFGFEHIFSRYVEALGREGDVLLAISTSGNSGNILNAAKVAREKGMQVVALTGRDGGKLSTLADIALRVPHEGYSDRIQEIHIKIIHILVFLIEKMTP